MSADVLAQLEDQVSTCNNQILQKQRDLSTAKKRLTIVQSVRSFNRAGIALRKFVDSSIVWRPGGVLILTTLMGGIGLALFQSVAIGIAASLLALVCAVFLLMVPSDTRQRELVQGAQSEGESLAARIGLLTSEVSQLRLNLETLQINQRAMIAAKDTANAEALTANRLKRLLDENWRAMRSVEFEKYLERVFAELGYTVETTRVTGDQGVDLLVSLDGQRIAIQVKGYTNSVSNSAVQEAHAGMAFYECHYSAVITNSLFTRSAGELAVKVRCALVDETNLPSLVMGKIDLLQMCRDGLSSNPGRIVADGDGTLD